MLQHNDWALEEDSKALQFLQVLHILLSAKLLYWIISLCCIHFKCNFSVVLVCAAVYNVHCIGLHMLAIHLQ